VTLKAELGLAFARYQVALQGLEIPQELGAPVFAHALPRLSRIALISMGLGPPLCAAKTIKLLLLEAGTLGLKGPVTLLGVEKCSMAVMCIPEAFVPRDDDLNAKATVAPPEPVAHDMVGLIADGAL
jgi:hypothetical protein